MATRITAPKPPADTAIDKVATATTLSSALPLIVAALRAILEESRKRGAD